MPKLKTEFQLETNESGDIRLLGDKVEIIGNLPLTNPYVAITIGNQHSFIQDKDLERFAVNILKALKSKHLNP